MASELNQSRLCKFSAAEGSEGSTCMYAGGGEFVTLTKRGERNSPGVGWP